MPEIAVLSDTHVPSRADSMPQWVETRLRDADHVLHAGDFDSASAYDRVYDLADGNLTAVAGNADPLSLEVPDVATAEFGGVRFVVAHGHGGGLATYTDRVARIVRENGGDVGVSGHTHELADRTYDELRLLNPGSATGAAPADVTSMLVVTVEDGDVAVTVEKR